MLDLNEPILSDDYPVYAGYTYLINDSPRVSYITGNVKRLKHDFLKTCREFDIDMEYDWIVVRRCDLVGRHIHDE